MDLGFVTRSVSVFVWDVTTVLNPPRFLHYRSADHIIKRRTVQHNAKGIRKRESFKIVTFM
jgi:hypothetical protein